MKCLVGTCLFVYLAGTLAGCGQKGPLVLPDAPKRKHALPALPAPAKPNAGASSPAPSESSPAPSPPPPAEPSQP